MIIRDGDFVGVTASNEFVAAKAVEAIKANWEQKEQISYSELFDYLRANPTEADDSRGVGATSATKDDSAKNSDKRLERALTHRLHRACAVGTSRGSREWNNPSFGMDRQQRPFESATELAETSFRKRTFAWSYLIRVPLTVGSIPANAQSRRQDWPRRGKTGKTSLDSRRGIYLGLLPSGGVIDVSSAVSKDGEISCLGIHELQLRSLGFRESVPSAKSSVHFHPTKYPLRQGSYRGLAATANHFARESHMDEMAACAGAEPLAFR